MAVFYLFPDLNLTYLATLKIKQIFITKTFIQKLP